MPRVQHNSVNSSPDEIFNSFSDLVSFLSSPGRDYSEVAQYLTLRTFEKYHVISLFIAKLEDSTTIRPVGGYGFNTDEQNAWRETSIEDNLPASQAVKNDEIVWIGGREEWEGLYPDLAHFPTQPNAKTLIVVPLSLRTLPIGAFGLLSSLDMQPNSTEISFLWSVSGLLGLYFSREEMWQENRISRSSLSRRQTAILLLLRERLTNQEIAQELGFSESTIRQETIRIYQLLGVSNRREAAAFRFAGER